MVDLTKFQEINEKLYGELSFYNRNKNKLLFGAGLTIGFGLGAITGIVFMASNLPKIGNAL